MNKLARNIKVLLGMEVALAESTLQDGTKIVYDLLEVKSPIFMVTPDGNIPAPVGEYVIEDGSTIKVTEDGVIGEIVKKETTPPAEEATTEVKAEDEIPATTETSTEPVVKTPEEKIASLEEVVAAQQERLVQIEAVIAELTTGFGAFTGDVTKLKETVEVIAKSPSTPSVFEAATKPVEVEMTIGEKRMQAIKELYKS